MGQKKKRPAPRERADLRISKTTAAFDPELIALAPDDQRSLAAAHLRRRFALPISTAHLVAELAGLVTREARAC